MRYLTIFPIIHSAQELGSVGPLYKKTFIKEKGLMEWKQQQAVIRQLWDRINNKLQALKVDYERVYLYQDAFPVGMDSNKMIEEMVNRGSRNYILIQSLMKKGACLMGTESPALLLEEYERLKDENSSIQVEAGDLLNRRDLFIAEQINKTLPKTRTGLLFIGAKHNLAAFLSPDIQVTTMTT